MEGSQPPSCYATWGCVSFIQEHKWSKVGKKAYTRILIFFFYYRTGLERWWLRAELQPQVPTREKLVELTWVLDKICFHQVVQNVVFANPLHWTSASRAQRWTLHPPRVACRTKGVHTRLQTGRIQRSKGHISWQNLPEICYHDTQTKSAAGWPKQEYKLDPQPGANCGELYHLT